MSAADVVIALATGLVAGTYAGLLGVGGGIIMVPAGVLLLGLEQPVAQGTSLLVIILTASSGSAVTMRRGLIDRQTAVQLGIGGVAGAVLGAILALRLLEPEMLRRIFGIVLLLLAGRLAFRRTAVPPSPPATPE